MEKELSTAVATAVTLFVLSVLITIVFFTAHLGRTIQGNVATNVQEIEDQLSVDFLDSIMNGEIQNEMPAATAFNIYKRYISYMSSVKFDNAGTITDITNNEQFFIDNLKGKVTITVSKDVYGSYQVLIKAI